MLLKSMKRVSKVKPAHILTLFFLAFCLYVGSAALPQLIYHTKCALGAQTFPEYIDTIDSQYHGMLETSNAVPTLHDKGTYINLNGFMANLLGQPSMNDRVKMKNGHLTSLVTTSPDRRTLEGIAANLASLAAHQAQKGGHFLFVLAPSQVSKYEDLLPAGYTDTTNETADRLLQLLQEHGVDYLDLRESMQEEGLTIAQTHYVTDHHWTPQTGFWAYGKILEKLAQIGAIPPVDPFYTDPANFTFETHPGTFLGSSGKRTGQYFAGVDDSTFIIPNFETEISITVPERNLALTGPFQTVAWNTEVPVDYENPDYFSDNVYGLYGWGDTKLTQWRNENAPQQAKFLLIGESFGNVPFCLMPLYIASCDEMDMRYYTEDFSSHYASFDPDTVILEVNVDQVPGQITTYPYFP